MHPFPSCVSIPGVATFAVCLALVGCAVDAGDIEQDASIGSTTEALSSKCARADLDPSLDVPAGNRLAFNLDAVGVQIYACQATATGFAWVFQAPEANLYDKHGRTTGTHYAGPTWHSKDGSKVVAARAAGFTPDATSIPWLLLQAVTHEGTGRMSTVTFIQRLDTVGGLAPSGGCTAEHVGELSRVDYAATYAFFEAGTPPCRCK